MTVTVEEVRELAGIQMSDSAIEQIINDAEAEIASRTTRRGVKFDTAVRRYAAYIAFISSETYSSVKVADITVKQDIEKRAKYLYDLAMKAIRDVDSTKSTNVVSTYMIDTNRPDLEPEENWYASSSI